MQQLSKSQKQQQLTQSAKNKQQMPIQEGLKIIKEIITCNPKIFNYLQQDEILDIINLFQKGYVNKKSAQEVLDLMLDYIHLYSHRRVKKNIDEDQYFQNFNLSEQNYGNLIGSKWLKIKNQLYFFKKYQLRILNFLVPNINEQQISFFQLNYDKPFSQAVQVAQKVREFYQYDQRSFFYLTNYLYISCLSSQKKGMSYCSINKKYIQTLKQLKKRFSPADQLIFDKNQITFQEFEQKQNKKNQLFIEIHQIQSSKQKQQKFDKFIQNRANQAKQLLNQFNLFMKKICDEYGCFNFKSGVKLISLQETHELDRIKQKLIKKEYQQLEKKYKKQGHLLQTNSLQKRIKKQISLYSNKINETLIQFKQPIQYTLTDMLRGKCSFSSIQKLNGCCLKIIQKVKESKQMHILKIQNKLKERTSCVVLKILIKDTVAQFQLFVLLNQIQNSFNHKIYQLQRSRLYSALTQLVIMNYRLTYNYLSELIQIVDQQNKETNKQKNNNEYYEQETNYQIIQQYLNRYKNQLTQKNIVRQNKLIRQGQMRCTKLQQKILQIIRGNKYQPYERNEQKYQNRLQQHIKYCMMLKNYGKAQTIIKNNKKQNRIQINQNIIYQEALLLYYQHKYEEAQKIFQQCLKKQKQREKIQKRQRQANILKGNYHKAIEKYKEYQKIVEKNNQYVEAAYNSIGNVYNHQGNYPLALEYYNKSLLIKKKIKGEITINMAKTQQNIGNIYKNQGKYPLALEYFYKSLQITKQIKGENSIDVASIYNNIGIVYDYQRKYLLAQEYYNKSLQIKKKIKGEISIDVAITQQNMGNLYQNQEIYHLALEYYSKSLQITKQIKGENSIDVASIYNNIGNLYKNIEKYSLAFDYYSQSLLIKKKIKGEISIDLAKTYNNIGNLYKNQGKYPLALEYYNKDLQITKKIKGENSIDVASTYNNIGIIYQNQGKYHLALEYFCQSFKITKQIKGKNSIDVALSYYNIGICYENQRYYPSALESYKKSLQITKKMKGENSIDVALMNYKIASLLLSQKQFAQAYKYYRYFNQIVRKYQLVSCYALVKQGIEKMKRFLILN